MNFRELSGAEDGGAEVPDFLEATVFSKEEAVIMVSSEYSVFIIKHEFQGVEWC